MAESNRQSTQHGKTENQGQRLSAADTRHYLDDYLRYRFGQAGSSDDFAKRAGIAGDVVKNLYDQKQISEDDLHKLADAISVSHGLLKEIAGYEPMPELMRQTLDRFFTAQQKAGQSGTKREHHEHKGAHAA